ncbi:hypothetical protein PI124_g2880 [Phytophthora idaei]|nr:hypothetical protein PI125_g6260 [Phytophthora idaei]KAG3162065.1 hypothetical protein PI126_g6129 [Phytophthora idaei]KAG3252518.1 hypothetical protein PI124_g2880 [Phytophthora idaei]
MGSPTLIDSKLSPSLGSSDSLEARTHSMQIQASELLEQPAGLPVPVAALSPEPSAVPGSPRSAAQHAGRLGPRSPASDHSFDPLAPFSLGHSSGSSDPAVSARSVDLQASEASERPTGSLAPLVALASELSATAPGPASQLSMDVALYVGRPSAAAVIASKLEQTLAVGSVVAPVVAVPA